jgi:hypothetical protein
MAAKIGGIFRVVNGQGGTKTVERLVPETTPDAIPNFNNSVRTLIAANTIFKTASQWATDDTVLASGAIGRETDTGFVKIGNGTTAWNSLGYIAIPTVIRHTSTQWSTTYASTVLNNGLIGYETDTNLMKIGDGTSTWANLDYVRAQSTTIEIDDDGTITTDDTITLTLS